MNYLILCYDERTFGLRSEIAPGSAARQLPGVRDYPTGESFPPPLSKGWLQMQN